MKPELEEKLFNKYPKIFRQKDLSPQETCMCWGISCGDGWYDLIDKLCSDIQDYIDTNNLRQIEAVQVKEKFGALRFYVDGADDYIWDLIHDRENESYDICESCGSKDNIGRTKGYILTICRSCAEKEKRMDNWSPKGE